MHMLNSLAANTLTLAQAGGRPTVWIWLMAAGFAGVCLIMMLVVLIQKPKGGGLSGAFGGGAGGGSTQAVIGARVGDVLTWTTVVCFVLFLLLACGMTLAIHSENTPAPADDEQATEQTEDADASGSADTTQDADAGTEEDSTPE